MLRKFKHTIKNKFLNYYGYTIKNQLEMNKIDEYESIIELAKMYLKLGWVKNTLAIDIHGNQCDCKIEKADKWCFVGSLSRANYKLKLDESEFIEICEIAKKILNIPKQMGLSVWNDLPERKLEDIFEVFDKVLLEIYERKKYE